MPLYYGAPGNSRLTLSFKFCVESGHIEHASKVKGLLLDMTSLLLLV